MGNIKFNGDTAIVTHSDGTIISYDCNNNTIALALPKLKPERIISFVKIKLYSPDYFGESDLGNELIYQDGWRYVENEEMDMTNRELFGIVILKNRIFEV